MKTPMASSVIKQKIKKNEPQNSGYKKPSNFPKNAHLLNLDTHTYVPTSSSRSKIKQIMSKDHIQITHYAYE